MPPSTNPNPNPDRWDESDRQWAAENLSEKKFQDFVERQFPSSDKFTPREIANLRVMREDRLVMTSRAKTFENRSQFLEGQVRPYEGLIDTSRDNTAKLLQENDRLH